MNYANFPERREFSQLGFNHSIATDLLAKVRSESTEKALPFFIDGLMEMSIAVTDRSLKFNWHDQEEFRHGAL